MRTEKNGVAIILDKQSVNKRALYISQSLPFLTRHNIVSYAHVPFVFAFISSFVFNNIFIMTQNGKNQSFRQKEKAGRGSSPRKSRQTTIPNLTPKPCGSRMTHSSSIKSFRRVTATPRVNSELN